jgi:type VI secretion system FHA domain protein
MPLIIQLTANDPALGQSGVQRIEVARRLTIGRGADNDVVLPDPNRHLSKIHCIIDAEGDHYTITDKSTNGVFLGSNLERLPRDTPTPLEEGHVLRLGGYQITIAAAVPSLPDEPLAAPGVAPIDDGLFGDPLAAPPPSRPSVPAGALEGLQDIAARRSEPPLGQLIPDDFDFGLDAPAAPAPPAEQPWGGSQPDHARAESAFFAGPRVKVEGIPDDWDAGLPSGAAVPSRAIPADADLRASARVEPARPRAARPAALSDDVAAGVAGFLAALGLQDAELNAADQQKLLRVAGEMLKAAIGGLMEILAARASTKQEFRIERTMVGAMRNNPLKFCASIDDAARVLLLARRPGFLAGKEAVDEALKDIKSHNLAVLAGMQVALTTLVRRLAPANLESRLERGSLIEGILPVARKAHFWDLFKSLYQEIAVELEEDFQKAFGAEFARAYQEQLDRL